MTQVSEMPGGSEELRLWNELWKRFNRIYYAYATRCGLSQSALDVLYAMATLGEGCTQSQICSEATLPKTTVNSSVKKLIGEGYMTSAAGTGRDVLLYLTDKGRVLFDETIAPLIRQEDGAFEALDPQMLRQAMVQVGIYADELERRLGLSGDTSGNVV